MRHVNILIIITWNKNVCWNFFITTESTIISTNLQKNSPLLSLYLIMINLFFVVELILYYETDVGIMRQLLLL